MPRHHLCSFRVRHYECDAEGRLAAPSYLRYMQETAFEASAAAGYSLDRYASLDRLWIVRETQITYEQPAGYGDCIQVDSWVADFRRVRSRRAYELRHAGSGCVIARAETDWAFVVRSSGHPAVIDDEMRAAFYPEGVPSPGAPRPHMPSPPPPPWAITFHRRVEWSDLDPAWHVNNANYLAYVEDCAAAAGVALGWPTERLRAEGIRLERRCQQLVYAWPAYLGDELRLTTWHSDLDGTLGVRHCTIVRAEDGALLARARTDWACTDATTGQPAPMPLSLRRATDAVGAH